MRALILITLCMCAAVQADDYKNSRQYFEDLQQQSLDLQEAEHKAKMSRLEAEIAANNAAANKAKKEAGSNEQTTGLYQPASGELVADESSFDSAPVLTGVLGGTAKFRVGNRAVEVTKNDFFEGYKVLTIGKDFVVASREDVKHVFRIGW